MKAFDTIVIGGDIDAIVAAIELAQRRSAVLLLCEEAELGGTSRQIEFSPGFFAAPLGRDLGWIAPEVLKLAAVRSLPLLQSDPVAVAFGDNGPLLLRRTVAESAAAIGRLSARDAARWPDFARRIAVMARFLEKVYRHPPPRVAGRSLAEVIALVQIGRHFRSLRRSGMEELLRTVPMAVADLLDDWFESPLLKGMLAAIGVRDLCHGPMSGGTAFNFLHQQVGAVPGVFSERAVLPGGGGSLVESLARKAQDVGVTIRRGAPVRRIEINQDQVSGVELASGEAVTCGAVITSGDPFRALLTLVDPVHLEVETIRTIRNVRYRGVTSWVLLALDQLPPLPISSGAPTGTFLFAPTIRAVERAYDSTKYGRNSDEPIVELHFPSIANPALAPVGKHVGILRVQYTPCALRDAEWDAAARETVGARALRAVEEHLPGFGACITAGQVLAPPDLESMFGLREGAVSRPEMALDQILFMRPFAEAARYASPVRGLFLCGAGTHPGPGIAGISGRLAAQAVVEWRKPR